VNLELFDEDEGEPHAGKAAAGHDPEAC